MPATMSEIAQDVGISLAVVSRVLREDPTLQISDNRRQDIFAAIERRGGIKVRKYRRKLPKQTRIVMVPVNRKYSHRASEAHPYFTESEGFVKIEETLKAEGISLYVTFFPSGEKRQMIHSLIHSSNQCDALLLLSRMADPEVADIIRTARFPHVCDSPQGQTFNLNCVRADAADGIQQAVAHLHSLGHRRIGYLGDRDFFRYPLTVAALMQMGLEVDEQHNFCIEATESSSEEYQRLGYTVGQQWLRQHRPVTALICRNDLLALGLVQAIKDAGRTPGKDLSIVGYDNMEQHSFGEKNPVLTTVDNPRHVVGRRIGKLLIDQLLHGYRDIVTELVPTKLIVRQTTGPCPAP